MAKVMFSNHRCVGCGLCARFCPNQAIEMRPAGKKQRPFWTYHCEVCLRCMGYGNKGTVEAGHSWAVVLYFLASIPVLSYLLYRLGVIYYKILGFGGSFFYELIYYLHLFIAIFISYWVFWNLIRITMVNKMFTFTTLTHYYRRYHQPETRLKQMALHKIGAKT